MTNEKMTEMLYEKMSAEQDRFRDWLLTQPPQEILQHAVEYSTREDILIAVKDNTLETAQLEALLKSPNPLADVYKDVSKLDDPEPMNTIRSCLENRANETLQAEREAASYPPVYGQGYEYAKERGEDKMYFASYQANCDCRQAIEAAIAKHHDGHRFNYDKAVKQVMDVYGPERVAYVLANTVQHKDWDGRISNSNKEWARTIPVVRENEHRFMVNSHPGLTDMFVSEARKVIKAMEQTKEKKPSVLKKLHEAAKESKAPATPRKAKEQER